jgi:hypothetical protein
VGKTRPPSNDTPITKKRSDRKSDSDALIQVQLIASSQEINIFRFKKKEKNE